MLVLAIATAYAITGSLVAAGLVGLAATTAAAAAVAAASRGGVRPALGFAWSGVRLSATSTALVAAGLAVGLVLSAWVAGRPDSTGNVPDRLAKRQAAPNGSPTRAVRSRSDRHSSTIARPRSKRLAVYARPGADKPKLRLEPRRIAGRTIPLVLLVDGRRGDWLRVYVPRRPNGGKGWVRRRHVALASTRYSVRIDVPRQRLTVKRGRKVLMRDRIGVGSALTPTPGGRYFVTDLLRQPDPRGLYGPFVFGLSGYSPVVTDFNGGDGQLGIHGTNDPRSIGAAVSLGCVRIRNKSIRRLARILPLGTPVTIAAQPKGKAPAAPAAQ